MFLRFLSIIFFASIFCSQLVQGSAASSSFSSTLSELLELFIDGKPCRKEGETFTTEEGARFTIERVIQERENVAVTFSHSGGSTEGSETLIALLSAGDHIEAVPDLSYDSSQAMAVFLAQENTKGRRASRKSTWNKGGEVSFEEGELWTPKIYFSTVFSTMPYKFMDWLYESDSQRHQTKIFVRYGFEGTPESAWRQQQVHTFSHSPQDDFVEIAGTFYCDKNGQLRTLKKVTYQIDTPAFLTWKQANGRAEEKHMPYEKTLYSAPMARVLGDASGYRGKYLSHESSTPKETSIIYVGVGGKLYACAQTRSTYKTKASLVGLEASETSATLQVITPTSLEVFVGADVTRERGSFYQNSYFERTFFDPENDTQDWREIAGETRVRLIEKANPEVPPFSTVDVTQALREKKVDSLEVIQGAQRDLAHFIPLAKSANKRLQISLDGLTDHKKKRVSSRFMQLLGREGKAGHVIVPQISGDPSFEVLNNDDISFVKDLFPRGGFEVGRWSMRSFSNEDDRIHFFEYLGNLSKCVVGTLDLRALNIIPHTAVLARLIRKNTIKDLALDLRNVDIPRTPALRPLEDAIIASEALTVFRPQHVDLATTDVRERNRESHDRRPFTHENLTVFLNMCQEVSWLELNVSSAPSSFRGCLLSLIERNAPTLVRLDLSYTKFPASTWERIFELLPSMIKLEHIEFHHTSIGNKQLMALAEKLRGMPSLKIIEMDMPYIASHFIDTLNVTAEVITRPSTGVFEAAAGFAFVPIVLSVGSFISFCGDASSTLRKPFGGTIDQGRHFSQVIEKLEALASTVRIHLYTSTEINLATQKFYKNAYQDNPSRPNQTIYDRNGFTNPDRVTFHSW